MEKESKPRQALVSDLSSKEIEQRSEVFKALANPIRMELLSYIVKYDKEVCGCDFDDHFDLKQPTISHHLGILQKAGLVKKRKEGTRHYYCIQSDTIKIISRYVLDLL